MKNNRVFISHSWSHVGDLHKLRQLLNTRGYFNVEFMEVAPSNPINSTNANYIKQQLRSKIQSSDIVLGIAGMYASYSDWMDWELTTAVNSNIPVIGIIPHGAQRVSTTVSNHSKEDIRWNTESIVSAIRKYT